MDGGDLRAKGADSGEERHDVTMVLKCILVSQFPAVCILRLFSPGTRISQSTAVNPRRLTHETYPVRRG